MVDLTARSLLFFDGLELLEPGIVPLQDRHPDSPDPVRPGMRGGTGRER